MNSVDTTIVVFIYLMAPGIETRILSVLCKFSVTKQHSQPPVLILNVVVFLGLQHAIQSSLRYWAATTIYSS